MSEELDEILISHFERELKKAEDIVEDCKKVLKKLKEEKKK